MATNNNKNGAVLWQEAVRQGNIELMITLLGEIREGQERMTQRIDMIEAGMTGAIEKHINEAFAGGDPQGHRRAHEVMISMMEERRKMYANLKEKTLGGLLWAGIIWGGWAALNQLRHMIGLPPSVP